MHLRSTVLYVVAGAAFLYGVHLMTREPSDPRADLPRDPEAGVRVQEMAPETLELRSQATGMPRPGSGYMGSGKPQAIILNDPYRETRPPEPMRLPDAMSDRLAAGDHRAQELKEVLRGLEGEPVYVDGVDGPKRRKKP